MKKIYFCEFCKKEITSRAKRFCTHNCYAKFLVGKRQSKEQIQKRVNKYTGMKRTLEQRENISKSLIGKRKGVVLSKNHKINISRGLKNAYTEGRKVFVFNEEIKKKMSKAHLGIKGYWGGKKRPEITGENHYKWSGGNGSRLLERNRFTIQIGNAVLKRDNYTCQMCGLIGGVLHVDHIQPWSEYVELRFCMDNCRTLCQKCHYFITFGREMPEKSKWGRKLPQKEVGGGLYE